MLFGIEHLGYMCIQVILKIGVAPVEYTLKCNGIYF